MTSRWLQRKAPPRRGTWARGQCRDVAAWASRAGALIRRALYALAVRVLPVLGTAAALGVAFRITRAARGVPSALGASTAEMRAVAGRSLHATAGRFANTEPSGLVAQASLPVIGHSGGVMVWNAIHSMKQRQ